MLQSHPGLDNQCRANGIRRQARIVHIEKEDIAVSSEPSDTKGIRMLQIHDKQNPLPPIHFSKKSLIKSRPEKILKHLQMISFLRKKISARSTYKK